MKKLDSEKPLCYMVVKTLVDKPVFSVIPVYQGDTQVFDSATRVRFYQSKYAAQYHARFDSLILMLQRQREEDRAEGSARFAEYLDKCAQRQHGSD